MIWPKYMETRISMDTLRYMVYLLFMEKQLFLEQLKYMRKQKSLVNYILILKTVNQLGY